MSKYVKFKVDFWETVNGNPERRFAAGKVYPADADTLRQVALGTAEETDESTDEAPAADADTLRQVAAGTDAPQAPAETGEASDAAPAAPTRGRGRASAAA